MHVVAALIERDGRLLIGQRRRGGSFALKWEFPGGKVRPGEPPEQALARELREELGVGANVGPELYRTRHRYAELRGELLLMFFAARLDAEPQCLAFEQICWAERSRLASFDFLPADRELVARLAAGEIAGP
jgi:8-oxo-dGTP diphosphatase